MSELFQVFTKGDYHLVLPDSECTVDTLQNLEMNGFTLRWDSAPSEFAGAKCAANYGAYVPVTRRRNTIIEEVKNENKN